MNLFLLEGPDGSGKTTLSRLLREKLEHDGRTVRYVHHGVTRHPWRDYLRTLVKARTSSLRGEDVTWVVDRAWPSEAVYGPVCRGVDRLADLHRSLERLALSVPSCLVMCRTDPGTMLQNWNRTREAQAVKSERMILNVTDGYLKHRTHLPNAQWNYQVDGAEHLGRIVDLHREWGLAAAPAGFTGAWRPQRTVLVLGEQSNGLDLPFIAASGCTPWLNRQLGNLAENKLTWANAYNAAGHPLDGHLVQLLNPLAIMPLGQRARAWVERNRGHLRRVEFIAGGLDHPQYHKRFKHHEPYDLVPALREIIG